MKTNNTGLRQKSKLDTTDGCTVPKSSRGHVGETKYRKNGELEDGVQSLKPSKDTLEYGEQGPGEEKGGEDRKIDGGSTLPIRSSCFPRSYFSRRSIRPGKRVKPEEDDFELGKVGGGFRSLWQPTSTDITSSRHQHRRGGKGREMLTCGRQ